MNGDRDLAAQALRAPLVTRRECGHGHDDATDHRDAGRDAPTRRRQPRSAPRSSRATSTSSTARSRRCSTSILDIRERTVTALHRPVRLRQVDVPALPQPHERHHPIAPGRPARSSSTARTSTIRASTWCELRARVGMVFQKPNPFPKSIFENVAYGPRIHGLATQQGRARRDRRHEPAARRPVRRGEGPARTSPAPASPAASSSASASRAPSPSARR